MNILKNNIFLKAKDFIIKNREKYPKLYVVILFFNKIRDKEFIELFFNRENILKYNNFGPLNNEKIIYFISINQGAIGFGAYFRWTLHALYDADSLKAYPVVYFGDKCPYRENVNIVGTDNPFEYYFEQPAKIKVEEVLKSNKVISFMGPNLYRIDKSLGIMKDSSDLPVGYKNISDKYIITLGDVVQKYIKLNNKSIEFISKSQKKIFRDNIDLKTVLAVHVRGTDFALHWDKHPNIVGIEDYFKVIDEAIEKHHFKYIFLATDDIVRLNIFKDKYNEKLLYFEDVNRTSEQVNVSFVRNDREKNRYLNGLECLRDMYTMAKCGGFIAGLSQVSISVRIINRSSENIFLYEKIIDKGVYNI